MKKYLKLSLFTFFIFLISILNVSAEENVELEGVELKEKSEFVEMKEETTLNGNKIKTNINFYVEGDYVIYNLTLKNNDDRDYKIKDIFDNNESEYLDFSAITTACYMMNRVGYNSILN